MSEQVLVEGLHLLVVILFALVVLWHDLFIEHAVCLLAQ